MSLSGFAQQLRAVWTSHAVAGANDVEVPPRRAATTPPTQSRASPGGASMPRTGAAACRPVGSRPASSRANARWRAWRAGCVPATRCARRTASCTARRQRGCCLT